jgi:hypothetical protein
LYGHFYRGQRKLSLVVFRLVPGMQVNAEVNPGARGAWIDGGAIAMQSFGNRFARTADD